MSLPIAEAKVGLQTKDLTLCPLCPYSLLPPQRRFSSTKSIGRRVCQHAGLNIGRRRIDALRYGAQTFHVAPITFPQHDCVLWPIAWQLSPTRDSLPSTAADKCRLCHGNFTKSDPTITGRLDLYNCCSRRTRRRHALSPILYCRLFGDDPENAGYAHKSID